MNRALRLLDRAFLDGDRVAVIDDRRTYTWGELAAAMVAAATHLSSRVARGSRVGLLLDSTPDFLVLQHAVHYLGGTVVPLNRALTPNEVAAVVSRLGLSLLLTDGGSELPVTQVVHSARDITTPAAIAQPTAAPAKVNAGDTALVLQTSGSTGQPKGVALSHANLAANYDPTARWIGLSSSDSILLALPLFNTYALNQGINLAVSSGATLRLLRRFDPTQIGVELHKARPTFIPLVPTMVTRLRQAGVRYDASVTIFVGAAPSTTRLAQDVWEVFPKARLLTGYGLTEATAIVTMQEVGRAGVISAGAGTTGRPVPGVEVRIDAAEAGRGEVLVRGAGVLSGYIGSDDPSPVRDGWLHTGDLGEMDAEGRLMIVGRSRELIIRGGQNVYPIEVEQALGAHPAVLEACVYPVPDAEFGEVPAAAFVLRNELHVSPDELQTWVASRLAAYKRPVSLVAVPELPRTGTGKVHRGAAAALVHELFGDSHGQHL